MPAAREVMYLRVSSQQGHDGEERVDEADHD